MISSRIFFFPESCVRQFEETSGKETFTAWAREGSDTVCHILIQGGPVLRVRLHDPLDFSLDLCPVESFGRIPLDTDPVDLYANRI
jgi:hypothetical protein